MPGADVPAPAGAILVPEAKNVTGYDGTIAFAIIFPLSMLLYSNSRITDVGNRVSDAKETLRAEFRAAINEALTPVNLTLQRIENKLDHYAETQANHADRIDKLENRG
jgi:hypothetical protein